MIQTLPVIEEHLFQTHSLIISLPDNDFGIDFLMKLSDKGLKGVLAITITAMQEPGSDRISSELQQQIESRILNAIPVAIDPVNTIIGNPKGSAQPRTALDLMARILRESTSPVTILALSNLTDLAILLMTEPNLKKQISRIVIPESNAMDYQIMGFLSGGILDPEAARFVLKSDIPITFVTAEALKPDTEATEFKYDNRYVSVETDGWSTRGTYVVDGLDLLKKVPIATVVHRYPFLI